MSKRRTYNRVQSFPNPNSDQFEKFDQFFAYKLQKSQISSETLSKILNASIIAQKMASRLAIKAISHTAEYYNSNLNFVNGYLDSTMPLLDSYNNVQIRLEIIRNFLNSIVIGLHYLEGEDEPSKSVRKRVANSFNFINFKEKKNMSPSLKTFGRKYKENCDTISPELYKALTGSFEMSVLAIEVFNSATLIEELKDTYLAAQTLLKLLSSWQNDGNNGLRRIAVRAMIGELKKRKDVLEKTLPMIEERFKELYKETIALRINLLGVLSKSHKEFVLEIEKFSCEKSQIGANRTQYQRSVTWVKVKTKMNSQSRPRCLEFIKRKISK